MKDFLGRKIEIGDEVIIVSIGRRTFEDGWYVTGFTTQYVKLTTSDGRAKPYLCNKYPDCVIVKKYL